MEECAEVISIRSHKRLCKTLAEIIVGRGAGVMVRERATEECTSIGEAYDEGYEQGKTDTIDKLISKLEKDMPNKLDAKERYGYAVALTIVREQLYYQPAVNTEFDEARVEASRQIGFLK